MATTTVDPTRTSNDVRSRSVLVVLVTRNAAGWLRSCLESLAAQTHPRLGVVAVDNGSSDGTLELLHQALGEGRVAALGENRGLAGALAAATELPPAQAADYLLLVHDDSALAPDAVERLLESAEGIKGVERVGVVGPKIVDWDDPRILREVGRSTDRFGHPYSPLQNGELDQGQYDRVLEVLFVSSAVMLVSREAWQRTGPFDERFAGHHDDLDFCWRARLAGFRVLMTPLATARHMDASARGERPAEERQRSTRYYADRAALASMLKDYGVLTLVWLLPVYAVVGLARAAYLALSRRFEDAFDLLAAWGWNILHLPGTLRRRIRAQAVRSVADRKIRPFMASTFRLPRWFEQAEAFLDEGLEEFSREEDDRPLPRKAAGVAAGHPVLLGSILAVGLGALAVRTFVGPEVLTGGALAAFPAHAADFFRELGSAVRTTVLGGVQPGSPALAAMGAGSWVAFGSTALAQKIFLGAMPAIAGIVMYRAMARETGSPAASVVAAAAYVLSALMVWAFSEGRLPLLVALAVLPFTWDRIDIAFRRRPPERPYRSAVGFGVALAIGGAFAPAIALPVGTFAIVNVVAGRRRDRGTMLLALGVAAGVLLAFPVVLAAAGDPAAALRSDIGTSDVWSLLRLAPGDGPGTWTVAAFLPVAAVVCFAGAADPQRGRAWRALLVAVAGTVLAWASVAGYLPAALTNAPAWLAAAAVAESALIAYGLSTFARALGRQAFGFRQLGVAILSVVLTIGVLGQALQVTFADWAVRPSGLPPAWPVIASSPPGPFRILWLGAPDGDPFPAPGGDPIGLAEAGDATVRFGLTDRDGVSALDDGRARSGPGYDQLHAIVLDLVAGGTRHTGALLGTYGVRFVVSAEGDLPAAARDHLLEQLDLDRVPAGGLTIFRNAAALPTAFVSANAPVPDRFAPAEMQSSPEVAATELDGAGERFSGSAAESGHVVVTQQFDDGWNVENAGRTAEPFTGYGWAIAAPVQAGDVVVRYTRQWVRTAEMVLLGLLWVAALWITRKPGSA
ncbi:MAG TPA: glycosyltransferase family 2 protein [Actinomycetota bacterium]|nr:glycosyltransferase family 2 protein [Actinomycetota bacterium]